MREDWPLESTGEGINSVNDGKPGLVVPDETRCICSD